jgi:hypothetical protein
MKAEPNCPRWPIKIRQASLLLKSKSLNQVQIIKRNPTQCLGRWFTAKLSHNQISTLIAHSTFLGTQEMTKKFR